MLDREGTPAVNNIIGTASHPQPPVVELLDSQASKKPLIAMKQPRNQSKMT